MKVFLWPLFLFPFVEGAQPKPCCVGNQFSASVNSVGGQIDPKTGNGSFADNDETMQFDFIAKQMTIVRPHGGQDGKAVTVLMDYNNTDMYVRGTGYCIITKYTEPIREACIPSNATYRGRSYFGSPSGPIQIDTWTAELSNLSMRISVTIDGSCTPIMYSTFAANGQMTYFFSNVTRSIADPSVFIKPRNCIRQ